MAELLRFYQPRGLKIIYAKGQYVWDDKWNKYLDLHTGYGVAFLGHRNPRVVARVIEQMGWVTINSPTFDDNAKEEVLRKLDLILPQSLRYVFFQNSGTEAVELALKLATYYTKKRKIVAFKKSFHGRTLGSLSLTWSREYRGEWEELLYPNVEFLTFGKVDELDKIGEDVAAVFVEPIQGEGGINVPPKDFLSELRRRTKEVGALLVVDEIQTGFGRTGKVWAYQHFMDEEPDILLAGKAIGNGFPVSFVAVNKNIADSVKGGMHGSTYGGNPLALAAVSASIDVLIEDDVPKKAEEKGKKFMKMLNDEIGEMKLVREIKGMGLMIGIELRKRPGKVIERLQRKGVLALKAGVTVLRFLPPYLITDEDMRFATEKTKESLNEELVEG